MRSAPRICTLVLLICLENFAAWVSVLMCMHSLHLPTDLLTSAQSFSS